MEARHQNFSQGKIAEPPEKQEIPEFDLIYKDLLEDLSFWFYRTQKQGNFLALDKRWFENGAEKNVEIFEGCFFISDVQKSGEFKNVSFDDLFF